MDEIIIPLNIGCKVIEWNEPLQQYMVLRDNTEQWSFCGLYDTLEDALFWEVEAHEIEYEFPSEAQP